MTNEGKVLLGANFDPAIARRVRLVSANLDISKSEFLRRAAEEFLKKIGDPSQANTLEESQHDAR